MEDWKKYCIYCKEKSTDLDALGLPCCEKHKHEADEYAEENGLV